jgi:hypothetical protein
VRRLGQISVIGLAALAIWLAMPGADEPFSSGQGPSVSAAPSAAVEAPAAESRSAGAKTARLDEDPAVPAGASSETLGPGEARAASQDEAADGPVDDSAYPVALDVAVRRGNRFSVDPPERRRRDTRERSETEAPESERRAAWIQNQGGNAPDPAPVDSFVAPEVPQGSEAPEDLGAAPDEAFEAAGDEALEPMVDEETLLDWLARGSLPDDATEADVRRQRHQARPPSW